MDRGCTRCHGYTKSRRSPLLLRASLPKYKPREQHECTNLLHSDLAGGPLGQKQSHADEEPWTSSNNMYSRNATAVPTASPEVVRSFLVLQRDFTPVNAVVAHVVFDARDTPHNCALGGIARPPEPNRYRIRVWARPPSTTDGPAQRSNRSRFF